MLVPGHSIHSLGKSIGIIAILATEEATCLASHSNWLSYFPFQGVLKGFFGAYESIVRH